MAFLDDTLALPPPDLAATLLQTVLGGIGLQLAPGKTQAWSVGSPCPPGLEPYWCPQGLTL
eukprot:2798082-Alexandrium_andersonii.AAC.1